MESTPLRNREDQPRPKCWKTIYTVTVLSFLLFFMQYAMRTNISVAIVPMADEFQWDEETQALILGSFYYGYVLTTFIGGRAAEVIGSRIVLGSSVMATSVLTLMAPIASRYSSTALIMVRVVQGMAESTSYPAMTFFLTSWSTNVEKTRVIGVVWTGTAFGTFGGMAVAGWLSSSSLGWPSAFYLIGAIGLIFGLVWFILVTDRPKDQTGISENGGEHIQNGIRKLQEAAPVPWRAIFKSFQVWICISAHFGTKVIFYTALSEWPTYLVEMEDFSVSAAGTISGFSYLLSGFFGVFYSNLTTYFLRKDLISVAKLRKLSAAICCYGGSICLITMMFNTSVEVTVAMVMLTPTIWMPAYSAHEIGYSDHSPRFCGTTFGIGNTIGHFPGFISTAIVGAFSERYDTVTAWNYIFLTVVIVTVVFTTPFILFFKAELQPWNDPQPIREDTEADETIAETPLENSVVE